jgi:hypothetical protein
VVLELAPATDELTDLDVGNVLLLEHLNIQVADQLEAVLFYLMGLGLTRDPYRTVGVDNMHVNVGENQFHLPTRHPAQVVPGHIGLVVPNVERVLRQLEEVRPRLAHTQIAWEQQADYLSVTCPWGNTFHVYEASSSRFRGVQLAVPYVEFHTRPGTAAGIQRFYSEVIGARGRVESSGGLDVGHVEMGRNQSLIFREVDGPIRPYDGHHVAIYIANFSGPYRFLEEHGLVTQTPRNNEYRFVKIIDPRTGEGVFELEHEVRSLHHPQFKRVLVNRDPS